MPPITDPHVARLIERTEHTARVVDEMRAFIVDVPMPQEEG